AQREPYHGQSIYTKIYLNCINALAVGHCFFFSSAMEGFFFKLVNNQAIPSNKPIPIATKSTTCTTHQRIGVPSWQELYLNTHSPPEPSASFSNQALRNPAFPP